MLLHIFIDILDRLSAWLKKFTGVSNLFTSRTFDFDLGETNVKPTNQQIRAKFDSLRESNRSGPKGVIVDKETNIFVVGNEHEGEPASGNVWNTMFAYCGRWYDVRRGDEPGA